MRPQPSLSWRKRWNIAWREAQVLLGAFRQPLSIFVCAVIGLGTLYYFLAARLGEPLASLGEAIYLMLALAFLETARPFPHAAVLQIFYFVLPVIGLATLAQGLADFGIMLFNRRARNKEWAMALTSTFHNHTVLVGLGHLGYRVVELLHQMQETIVVIEHSPVADLLETVQRLGIPVIVEDATRPSALEAAGVRRACAIVLCTQNDSLNLQIAVKARSMNPALRVVIRIFDDDFARSLQEQFGFLALSATGIAAPAFAAAATGADVSTPISIEGQPMSVARLTLAAGSRFHGQSVGEMEEAYHLNVVLVRRNQHSETHPPASLILQSGDTLAVLGGLAAIHRLLHDNT